MNADRISKDEQAIRDVISTWMRASAAGDLNQVLDLMDEDVVFLVPGQPPMRGREGFAAALKAQEGKFKFAGASEVQEIHVAGDWAYCWSKLRVTVTPLSGDAEIRRSGNTLSIFRKNAEGNWVLFRDANLLAVEKS